ncbi:YheC/YheD family protein [Paenibacillus macquariensis]|uniref:YheC/D like ATP-grasp n=1 Tax=Paenibacillus macquariensis TaxID=948756 RepID=A0ABY1KGU1_9BACL|nr:YheC/YheD family protein [Paenibacillus macquariensis]OAB33093.1 hypothetical protein PMSM_16190 [Paenibacillus macquariensis subsp. macquariensis]SIR69030.1 YheC/D like ATP-grasp [Paenibacillus macquariensis]
MNKYRSSTIESKWKKTSWLLTQRNLSKHVPRTRLFQRDNLTSMLSDYSTVFFKPTTGSGGVNIIRIKKVPQGYQTQLKSIKSYYSTINALYSKLNRVANRRSYVLQMGIQLAKTNGKPFDIRVMVQKTDKDVWQSTAVFTKIGSPGMVATNYNQGGTLGYFNQTMSGAGYNLNTTKRLEAELKQLGVNVAKNFDRHMRGFRELGLDVALDSTGKLWIMEVNTRPQFYPLKNMKDKTLYRQIVSFAKAYGRYK